MSDSNPGTEQGPAAARKLKSEVLRIVDIPLMLPTERALRDDKVYDKWLDGAVANILTIIARERQAAVAEVIDELEALRQGKIPGQPGEVKE